MQLHQIAVQLEYSLLDNLGRVLNPTMSADKSAGCNDGAHTAYCKYMSMTCHQCNNVLHINESYVAALLSTPIWW